MINSDWEFWLYIAMLCICVPLMFLALLYEQHDKDINSMKQFIEEQQAVIETLRKDVSEYMGIVVQNPRLFSEADLPKEGGEE